MMEFISFGKIPRLSREIIITEKIDGTNAQIFITDDGDIFAGSRNRWLSLTEDNFGFAKWVDGNKNELLELGPGRHFGEWWGYGIQSGYGLDEKRFSLFNVHRWGEARPDCCHVVPELYRGDFDSTAIYQVMRELEKYGSVAAPGFMNPEGIIVYHTAANKMFKKTIKNDTHKGER